MRQSSAAEEIEERGDTAGRLGICDIAKPFTQDFRIHSRRGDGGACSNNHDHRQREEHPLAQFRNFEDVRERRDHRW